MTAKELQNKLSARFDFDEWKGILIEMFPKVEFFTSVNPVSYTHLTLPTNSRV